MNKEVLLTVLGVIGTLGGTLLGWLLNAYTYKIGRTEIRGTFETRITMPPARPDDAAGGTVKKEYFIKCCAKNSRQIAVLLENFHFAEKQRRENRSCFCIERERQLLLRGKGSGQR